MRVDVSEYDQPCSCGRTHTIEVREIVIEAGAVKQLEEMIDSGILKDYITPVIICDTNTYKATEEIMENIYDRCETILLDAEGLHADNHGVDIIHANYIEGMDLIIAVGSGTIHDLSRYVAYEEDIPFVSVPTAASVGSYASTVAAMTWNGMKKMVPAAAPICVIADTDIFAAAPKRLTAAGASDLLGKYICLADWKIAHVAAGEYICDRILELEEQSLEEIRDCIRDIGKGEPEACEKLMYALILSGLTMQMLGSAVAASGAEHHISHLWEMEILDGEPKALHGELVSAATVVCAKYYAQIADAMEEERCQAEEYQGLEQELLERTFGVKGLMEAVIEENTPDAMGAISPEQLEKDFPEIVKIIRQIPTAEELEELLEKGGCKKHMEEIGLSESMIPMTLQLAPYVRNQLTLLRLGKMLEISEKGEMV